MQEMWLSGYIGTRFGIWKLILVQTLIQTVSFFHSPPSLSHASICECVHACVHARVPASVRTCVCVCACMCACGWVCLHVCACVCVCVHAHTCMHLMWVSACVCILFSGSTWSQKVPAVTYFFSVFGLSIGGSSIFSESAKRFNRSLASQSHG